MYDSKLYQRLIAKVRKDEATGCWIWQGFVHVKRRYPGNRYGTIRVCLLQGFTPLQSMQTGEAASRMALQPKVERSPERTA